MKNLISLSKLSVLSIAALILSTSTVNAQPLALRTIGRNEAVTSTTAVRVWSGRSSAIDFTQTGEIITYILIADPSRTVYTTDAPLNSNQARTVFLKVIKPLNFPGATTAPITNLSIKTIDPNGQQRLYTFNIVPGGTPTDSGISVSPITPNVEQSLAVGRQTATLSDIERGLQIAIARKYTAPNDSIVFKVREFIALARNTSSTIPETAAQVKLSLSVLTSLGQLGLEELRVTPQPTPPQFPLFHPTNPVILQLRD